MMGGTPYGRSMAMTDDDLRDGLALDAYTARLGPFLDGLPDGLQLELTLQGDAVQNVQILQAPLIQTELASEPLLQAAALLRLLELPALAERCIRAAITQHRPPRLLIQVSGALRAIPVDLCRLPDGSDARMRLAQWVRGVPDSAAHSQEETPSVDTGSTEGLTLQTLLAGREWHEALLGINSLPRDLLVRLCHRAMSVESDEQSGSESDKG